MSEGVLFKINGVGFPLPMRGYKEEGVQMVSAKRNMNAVVVADLIGPRLKKFDGLVWQVLTARQWRTILAAAEVKFAQVEYFEVLTNKIETTKFYFGDDSAEPCAWEDIGGFYVPTKYKNCKVNLIDTGER